METYRIQFNGRKNGAIGITYPVYKIVDAESQDDAMAKLYDEYEHITAIKFLQVDPQRD